MALESLKFLPISLGSAAAVFGLRANCTALALLTRRGI